MSHTPWVVERVGVSEIFCEILNTKGPRYRVAEYVLEKDAHLIAAAPELLAALKALLASPAIGQLRSELWEAARAAIAKAEGK